VCSVLIVQRSTAPVAGSGLPVGGGATGGRAALLGDDGAGAARLEGVRMQGALHGAAACKCNQSSTERWDRRAHTVRPHSDGCRCKRGESIPHAH
jgi:hypothetical protein